jgi:hypothetical protein
VLVKFLTKAYCKSSQELILLVGRLFSQVLAEPCSMTDA